MKKWLQKKFIRFLVKNIYHSLTYEDVLMVKGKGSIIYKGRVLNAEEIAKTVVDARTFNNSVIWQMIKEDVIFQAQDKMFRKSNSMTDILGGKLLLYTLNEIDKSIEKITKL